jgi:hypothetical protein
MGALIPIGQGADAEIKLKLNVAFSGANLTNLQKHWKNKEKLFDPAHRLARIAYREKLHPTKIYSNNARGKWYYLLSKVLPQASDGSTDAQGHLITTDNAIKSALTFALDDTNGITRVVFEAEEQSGAPAHFVYPTNATPGVQVGTTLNIILVCPAPLSEQNVSNPPDDNDPDPGEKQLPTISFAKRKRAKKK